MGKLDYLHLLLSKAWVAHSIIPQRFPERLHIKVLLLNVKKDAGNGLLSGWFHHQGAHRASPRGDVAGFNALFFLLAAWAYSHHCFHCERFSSGAKPKFREHVLKTHLAAWLPTCSDFPPLPFPHQDTFLHLEVEQQCWTRLVLKAGSESCWLIRMRHKSTPNTEPRLLNSDENYFHPFLVTLLRPYVSQSINGLSFLKKISLVLFTPLRIFMRNSTLPLNKTEHPTNWDLILWTAHRLEIRDWTLSLHLHRQWQELVWEHNYLNIQSYKD